MASAIDSNRLSSLAVSLGSRAQQSEDSLMTAFQLKDTDKKGIEDLGKKLGLTAAEIKESNPKSLQIIAQQKHSESQSMLGLLSEIIKAGQQIRDRIISNIGR